MSCLCTHYSCVYVHSSLCVSCQAGSLAGWITAVGAEGVHCPFGEKTWACVYCEETAQQNRTEHTAEKYTLRDIHAHHTHGHTKKAQKRKTEKHIKKRAREGTIKQSSFKLYTYNVHPNQHQHSHLNTLIYALILKNAKWYCLWKTSSHAVWKALLHVGDRKAVIIRVRSSFHSRLWSRHSISKHFQMLTCSKHAPVFYSWRNNKEQDLEAWCPELRI